METVTVLVIGLLAGWLAFYNHKGVENDTQNSVQ